MSIVAWIILGLVAGVIASKIINKAGEGFALDIVVAVGGAVAGGLLFHQFGTTETIGFSPVSMLYAVIGSILALSVARAIVGKGQVHT
jgi:uncharacterized membrane protein YeaQ/YmgE (transglycosylase-associated protein family)